MNNKLTVRVHGARIITTGEPIVGCNIQHSGLILLVVAFASLSAFILAHNSMKRGNDTNVTNYISIKTAAEADLRILAIIRSLDIEIEWVVRRSANKAFRTLRKAS